MSPLGALVALDEQDRSRWDQDQIREGTAILDRAAAGRPPSPYLLQAAIAALHAEASRAETTDWPQILVLYRLLEAATDSPVVTLNRAVAEVMVHGPAAGLSVLDTLAPSRLPANHHRLLAVRAHLQERAGLGAEARETYRLAAQQAQSVPEREYLLSRARRLQPPAAPGGPPG